MITFIFILFSIFLLGLIFFLINNYFKNKNLELSPQEKMDKEAPYHQFASILILIFPSFSEFNKIKDFAFLKPLLL